MTRPRSGCDAWRCRSTATHVVLAVRRLATLSVEAAQVGAARMAHVVSHDEHMVERFRAGIAFATRDISSVKHCAATPAIMLLRNFTTQVAKTWGTLASSESVLLKPQLQLQKTA